MCLVLNIPRSTYYSITNQDNTEVKPDPLKDHVIKIFKESRNNYGTRKIKKELEKQDIIASRRRIGRIMRENGLVSTYTVAQYKVHHKGSNESEIRNVVNREFQDRNLLEVVVSDLTYVRVEGKWHYVCLILDLHNREIIGFSADRRKNAKMVYRAFASINRNLSDIQIFHTDRGNEFKNNVIDGLIAAFGITRSLSHKGCPYDNAVAEATFKVFKTEFVYPNVFDSLEHLEVELKDYVNWYNNFRIHSSLDYMTPVEYRIYHLRKIV